MTAAIAGLLLASAAMTSPPPPAHALADSKLLARVVAESRVERAPAKPKGIEYAQAWGEAFERLVRRLFERYDGVFGSVTRTIEIGAYVLIAAAIVLALVLIGRRVLRPAAPGVIPGQVASAAAVLHAPARDAEAWRQAFERLVAQGSPEKALEALWWWFALSLSRQVDPSWTNRQLLAAADRMDLAPQVGDLDQTMYGPRSPRLQDLPAMFERLKEAIV